MKRKRLQVLIYRLEEIIAYQSYHLIREKDVPREIREDKEWKQTDNETL